MYCRDCKFYKYDRTDEIIDEDTYEVLKKIKRGTCNNSNLRFAFELEDESQLIYHDSMNYSAGFYVGELFGCVHFERKLDINTIIKIINNDFIRLENHISKLQERPNSLFNLCCVHDDCDALIENCKNLAEVLEEKP